MSFANAFIAGYLVECGSHCSGGSLTGFKQLGAGVTNLGFPIEEIASNGEVIMTTNKDTDGVVSIDSYKSQQLYKIRGP